ncbi:hypothetical protein [Streptomyces sp. NPDC048650]|uniref:hypothetical protein n=1 Tax=unclassified Streptomyces TaxID=2593676 RepID=UPI00371BA377
MTDPFVVAMVLLARSEPPSGQGHDGTATEPVGPRRQSAEPGAEALTFNTFTHLTPGGRSLSTPFMVPLGMDLGHATHDDRALFRPLAE